MSNLRRQLPSRLQMQYLEAEVATREPRWGGKTPPPAPECDKMVAAQPKSQAIGEFLDWLGEQGVVLCRQDPLYEEYEPDYMPIEKRLALYFNIDLDKVERERQRLLLHLRARHDE